MKLLLFSFIGISLFVCYYLLVVTINLGNSLKDVIPLDFCEDPTAYSFNTKNILGQPVHKEFCHYLCSTSLNIHHHDGSFSILSVSEQGNHSNRFILKVVVNEGDEDDKKAYWLQNSSEPILPPDEVMEEMMRTHFNSILWTNSHLPFDLSFKNMTSENKRDLKFHEMLWSFIKDHEFFTAYIFRDFDLFPRIIGTCGMYYAVEYYNPISLYSFISLFFQTQLRLRISIQILKLIQKLQSEWIEPLHLCDMKLEHFGFRKGSAAFLDLDCVFSDSYLGKIMQNTPFCSTDDDCSVFDCVGKCLPNNVCSSRRQNSNLEVLCWKIFLGKINGFEEDGFFNRVTSFFAGLLPLHLRFGQDLHDVLHRCSLGLVDDIQLLSTALEVEYKTFSGDLFEL